MEIITIVVGWVFAVFVGGFALAVLWLIVSGRIDLRNLISEKTGDASLSRFQFLIFTFTIAMSFFVVVAGKTPPDFPASIPGGVFALLGISGGSYVVSKGIQTSKEIGLKEKSGKPEE